MRSDEFLVLNRRDLCLFLKPGGDNPRKVYKRKLVDVELQFVAALSQIGSERFVPFVDRSSARYATVS